MIGLPRFWQALETLPTLGAVTAEWRALLGNEFELARRFLRPRAAPAASFPCFGPRGAEMPYTVVNHGVGDIVGVCPETSASIPLTTPDLIVFELDLGVLSRQVAAAVGIELQDSALQPNGRTIHLGDVVRSPGDRYPAFLSIPYEPQDLHLAITGLAAELRFPLLFMAPTRRGLDRTTESVFRATGSAFMPLSEAVATERDGRLQSTQSVGVFLRLLRRSQAVAFSAQPSETGKNTLQKDGKTWKVVFANQPITLEHWLGWRYVTHLIARKGREYPAMLLLAIGSGKPVRMPGSGTEVLDEQAICEYEQKYDELCASRERAKENEDGAHQESVDRQIDALAAELSSALGLGGRRRTIGDEAEKARKSISNAIRRAINGIEERYPAFARHLDASIRGGRFFSYAPEPDVEWDFR